MNTNRRAARDRGARDWGRDPNAPLPRDAREQDEIHQTRAMRAENDPHFCPRSKYGKHRFRDLIGADGKVICDFCKRPLYRA